MAASAQARRGLDAANRSPLPSMESYDRLKRELIAATSTLEALMEEADALPGLVLQSIPKWRDACRAVREQMTDDRIRIAVVGPIKSGKSTFANALLGGDYLKRGAGVVTSIVTRIRRGESLAAELDFKTWEAVNDDVRRARAMLPDPEREGEGGGGPFDIRRESDRKALALALERLNPDQLIADDARDANSALLSSYLTGYEGAAPHMDAETAVVRFDASRFHEHRRFAGEDALAVYLEDIRLTVPSEGLESPIELADCQGSDSPNPRHLAMIQEYLMTAHLIVYVISSRTGLRRADIHFLSIIRKMGIADHLLFVLNVDFGEHESAADLESLAERVRDELALMVPEPVLFAFSALYHLLEGNPDLPERERLRLRQWEAAPGLVALSRDGLARFRSVFQDQLTADAMRLLLSNPSERLFRIADAIAQLTAVKAQVWTADADRSGDIVGRVRRHMEEMTRLQDAIHSTLAGGRERIQGEMRTDIDRFFDDRYGEVMPAIVEFVRGYSPPASGQEESLRQTGFQAALYRCYQDFRQALETHLAEVANPEVVRFIRGREAHIAERLHELIAPYRALVREAVDAVGGTLSGMGIATRTASDLLSDARLDMADVRREARLELPSLQAIMRFSTQMKTEAVARLGVYRIWRWVRRLWRKPAEPGFFEERKAMEDSLRRLKKETEAELRFHFKDIRENIKFGYLFKLLDAGRERLAELLLDRVRTYIDDLEQMLEGIDGDQADRSGRAEHLLAFSRKAGRTADDLQDLRRRIRGTA